MNRFSYILYSAILMFLTTGCAHTVRMLNVDLGAAATALPPAASNVYRIFIDQVGNVYPDTILSRKAVRAAGYRLDAAFAADTLLQKQLLRRYNPQLKDSLDTWQHLQQAIAHTAADHINQSASGYTSITVLIHGIGNDINQDNRLNRNPYDAFSKAELRIDSILKTRNQRTFFVEVYWDALHRVKRTDFVAVFAGAHINAYYAGMALRGIVSQLHTDSLVVLTHSLGASVGCQLLFNQPSPHQPPSLNRYLTAAYTDTANRPTPPQKSVRLGMIVPAIPGKSTFENFYQRTGHAAPMGSEKDRYAVWVGYNNKDKVIAKSFIAQFYSPLVIRYAGGSTALGALRGENKKVARLFARRYPQSSFTGIDFQEGGGVYSPHTTHYFSSYCDNQHFPELIEALFK